MPGSSPTRPSGRLRIPRTIWAATLSFAALAAVWSVVAPLGEAPDETAHLALVWHLADGHPYPDYDDFHGQAGSFRLCATYASAIRACPRSNETSYSATSTRRHPRAEAPDKGNRPAWNDAGGAETVGPPNQMSQHPPAYYRLTAAALQAERGVLGHPLSADRELALLRLLNVLLIAPLPLLGWWTARRFGYRDDVGVAAALATFAVPMLTHIGSTLNNDNLFVLLTAIATALLAGVLRGERRTSTAVALGVVTGLALLTKGFGVVLPPLVLGAYVVGSTEVEDRWGARLRGIVRPLAWAGGLTLALAAWWYVRVHARTGQFTPSLEQERLTSALRPAGFTARPLWFVGEFARLLDTRFWGSFGWYSVRTPTWVAGLASVVVLVAFGAALAPRHDESGAGRLRRAALLAPAVALGAFVLVRAWDLYLLTGGMRFIQGRYLLAGVTGAGVLAAAGACRLPRRTGLLAVAAFAAVAQFEALRETLPGWWGDTGLGPRGQVRAMVAWSAWPGEALVLLAVVAAVAAGWLAWELVALVRAPAEGDPTAEGDAAAAGDVVEPSPEDPGPLGSIPR